MKSCIFEKKDYFPIYPVTISHNYLQYEVIRPAGLEINQIFVVVQGNGIININGKKTTLEKGDMYFLPKGTIHSYRGDKNFRTSFLGFDGYGCNKIFECYKLGIGAVYKEKNYETVDIKINNLYKKIEKIHTCATLSQMAYDVVMTFLEEISVTESTPIEKVRNFLEANFDKPITVDDILEIYPYSKSKLCRDFLTAYGTTVFRMLNEIRLTHADIMLLSDPGLKLKEISEKCGFTDESYFCKVYRQIYGRTPKNKKINQ